MPYRIWNKLNTPLTRPDVDRAMYACAALVFALLAMQAGNLLWLTLAIAYFLLGALFPPRDLARKLRA